MPCYRFELKDAWRIRYLPANTAHTLSGEQIDISRSKTLNQVVRTVYAHVHSIAYRDVPIMGNSACCVVGNVLHIKCKGELVHIRTNVPPTDTYEEWLTSPPEMKPPTFGTASMQRQPGVRFIPDYVM